MTILGGQASIVGYRGLACDCLGSINRVQLQLNLGKSIELCTG